MNTEEGCPYCGGLRIIVAESRFNDFCPATLYRFLYCPYCKISWEEHWDLKESIETKNAPNLTTS